MVRLAFLILSYLAPAVEIGTPVRRTIRGPGGQ